MNRAPYRRRSALALHELHYGPNMTPMVDVVMVILIFFMAGASIMGPEWLLRTALPTPKPAAMTRDSVRLSFRLHEANGAAVVTGEGLEAATLDAFRERLTHATRTTPAAELGVVVTPDWGVPYESVVAVHEIAHGLGVTKIGLTDPASAPTGR